MNWLLVFVGGGVGSLLRYAIACGFPTTELSKGHWPWATLSANLLACLLLGAVTTLLTRGVLSKEEGLLLATGLCGGFSTFSTFSGELLALFEAGQYGVAVGYLLASVIGGLLSIGLAAYLLR